MDPDYEIAYIQSTLLEHYGFKKENLFDVINRFDLLPEQYIGHTKRLYRELLSPYTEHIYYVSAQEGLQAQKSGNTAQWKDLGILDVKSNPLPCDAAQEYANA